jgi:uncharacterized protein YeaO (DUF488 family)
MTDKIKKFEEVEYEHTNENGEFDYDLMRKFDSSNPDYTEFRKHYTKEIQEMIERNGRFVMTHDLTANIILDVSELIKKAGYDIIKK